MERKKKKMNGTAPPCIVHFSKKTGEGFFQQGKIKFPINPHNLSEAVYAVDELPKDTWKAIARQNGLSIQPFSTKLLRPIIMGFVQNAWYSYIKGEVPPNCTLNQIARLSKYEKDLEWERNNAPAASASSPRTPKEKAAVKQSRVASISAAPDVKPKKMAAHEKQVFDYIKKNAGTTTADIAAALDGKFENTKQTAKAIVGFWLRKFRKQGWILEKYQ